MLSYYYGAWDYWVLYKKITIDGINRIITVDPGVTSLDIRVDLYSAYINWVVLRDNLKYTSAIRYTGYDPIGVGQFTGDSYFLINGWKFIVDLSKVRITGVLFSDDYDTAFYTPELVPQYPATVAALVNTVAIGGSSITAAEVRQEIDTNSEKLIQIKSLIDSITIPTAQQVAEATWAHTFANKLLTVAKFLGLK